MLFVLLLLLAATPSLDAALDPSKSWNAFAQKTWGTDQGLPQNAVTAMAQSQDGYIWFGTKNGLARFDGVRFKIFDKQHFAGLLSNQISSLAADQENSLWIGTVDGGLSRYSRGEFQSFFPQSEVPGHSIRCLHSDGNGSLWIGTENSGLIQFRSGVFQTFTIADGLLANSITALTSDAKGGLWIATSAGLNLMEHGKLVSAITGNSAIRSLYADRDHTLWLGTDGQGLLSWRGSYGATFTKRQGLSGDTVTSILRDSAGALWVGTLNGGVDRILDGKVSAFPVAESASSLMEDREGGFWVGTAEHGATCLRNRAINTISHEAGLPSDAISPVFEDSEHALWVGTNRGLARIQDNRIDRFTIRDGLPDELVSSIGQDGGGNLWIGTRLGLARFSGKRFYSVASEPALIHCIMSDRSGDIWAGSESGLTHFDGKQFVTYSMPDGLPSNHVFSVHQSRDGAIWIGTDRGLAVLRDGRFSSLTAKDGLPNDSLWAISEDAGGNILLGSGGSGLIRFANGRFTAFGTAQGLPDDTIYQIIDDHNGRLWCTCSKGIFSLPSSLRSVNYKLYGTGDGMLTRECNGGFQPAGVLAHDGRIWFPTTAGLSVINPAELYENYSPLNVNIEAASVDGESASPGDVLNLRSGQKTVAFQFAAPSFSFDNHVQFRYWLTGFDETWSAPTTEQTVRYTNLPPGHYQLRVAASRDGQNWIAEAQPVMLSMGTNFYQSSGFYAGSGACFVLLLSGFHYMRVRAQRKRKPLLQIEAPTRDLLQLNESLRDKTSFSLPALLMEVEAAVSVRAQSKGLRLHIGKVSHSLGDFSSDPKRLKQILLSLLNYAIECTPRGVVDLRVAATTLSPSEALLHFSITDTGVGVLAGGFNELWDSIHLARTLGGELWVESEPGAGNTFHLKLGMPVVSAGAASVSAILGDYGVNRAAK